MAYALELSGLKKRYGCTVALDGLDLAIPVGASAAFVGANGAGKTTTFSLIAQYIRPDRGQIKILGGSISDFRSSGKFIGITPQDVGFFDDRNIGHQFLLFARLAGFSKKEAAREVERVLGLVKLDRRISESVDTLSHGMKVRLGIAQALIGSPPLILLDEPTAGLDPRMISEFRSVIESIRGSTTIVISSHDLSQLQLVCDYVCIIDHGKLVKQGSIADFLQGGIVAEYTIAGSISLQVIAELQAAFSELMFAMNGDVLLRIEANSSAWDIKRINRHVIPWLLEKGIEVIGVKGEKTLEEVYLTSTDRA